MPIIQSPDQDRSGNFQAKGNLLLEKAMSDLIIAISVTMPMLFPDIKTGGILGIKTNSGMVVQFNYGPMEGLPG